jgi:hypothetical protein
MAEANEKDNRRKGHEKFAAREPGLTVLTDHALRPEQGYLDNFNLRYRLGHRGHVKPNARQEQRRHARRTGWKKLAPVYLV